MLKSKTAVFVTIMIFCNCFLFGQDVIVPINEITTSFWNTLVCPQNPDLDWNNVYEGRFSDKDVNKLLSIPYSNNNVSGNPFIDNHTFWFAFGCCGKSFCADDRSRKAVHTDNFYNVGSLKLYNVNIHFDTSVWVDFLTQCENCSGAGEAGTGVWHKWEKEFYAGELRGWRQYPNGNFGAEIKHVMQVPCDAFSSYGCQSSEQN